MTKITTDAQALAVLASVHESIEFDYGVNGAKEVRELRDYLAARLASTSPAPAQPKLIGWRTDNFLMETSDESIARNWECHYRILPIFEGDAYTKLAAPQPVVEKDNG